MSSTKQCTLCKEVKDLSEFGVVNKKYKGRARITVRARCIPCHRQATRESVHKTRKRMRRELGLPDKVEDRDVAPLPPVTPLELEVKAQAACKGSRAFQESTGRLNGVRRAALRSVCEACPVLQQCAEWADWYESLLPESLLMFTAGEAPIERAHRLKAGLPHPYLKKEAA